jgi:hypothetical protein
VIGFDGRFIVRWLVCESLEHGRREDCIRNSSVRICAQFHNTRGWTSLGLHGEE